MIAGQNRVGGETRTILFTGFSHFFRASGEAIRDTPRYFSKDFLNQFCSRLRRCDCRYTTILVTYRFPLHFIHASGEAIVGTQRYYSKSFLVICSRLRRGDFRYKTIS